MQASEGFTGSSDVSEEQQRRQHSWSPVSECVVRRRPEDGQEPGEATEVKWGDSVHLCRQGTEYITDTDYLLNTGSNVPVTS